MPEGPVASSSSLYVRCTYAGLYTYGVRAVKGRRPPCQVKYNLIDRAAEHEPAPACQQFGLSLVPYAPLHGGLLADLAACSTATSPATNASAQRGSARPRSPLPGRSSASAVTGNWRLIRSPSPGCCPGPVDPLLN
jgi:hypothetical protein